MLPFRAFLHSRRLGCTGLKQYPPIAVRRASRQGVANAILANLSPDSGNLVNFESVWLQNFGLANFWRLYWLTYSICIRFTTFKLADGLKIREINESVIVLNVGGCY